MKRRDVLKGSVVMSLGIMNKDAIAQKTDENPFPPTKIEMKSPAEYSPLTFIEKVREESAPKMAFNAKNVKDAEIWQTKLRAKLWELVGENSKPSLKPPSAKLLETTELEDHIREKWELYAVPGRSMPFYILRPKKITGQTKTVICLHGHGNGAKDIIGLPVNDEATALIKTLNTDYALKCVRKGWIAVAPELFTFGERVDYVEGARPGFDGGCEKPFLNAIEIGKTLIGIRTKDVCLLMDWMSSQKDFNMDDLGCMGLSGGGMLTMYLAAMDLRVKRAIISGYMTMSKDSIMNIRHCSCSYVPSLLLWADFPDIGGLIAPRPLIIQSGKRDGIFPNASARTAFAKLEKIYNTFGKSDMVKLNEHNGFHSFSDEAIEKLYG